jgi:hypothetical protein
MKRYKTLLEELDHGFGMLFANSGVIPDGGIILDKLLENASETDRSKVLNGLSAYIGRKKLEIDFYKFNEVEKKDRKIKSQKEEIARLKKMIDNLTNILEE